MESEDSDILIKIVIVGNSSVGKTNLVKRFIEDRFNENQKTTVGFDFVSKDIEINGQTVKVQLWDTAGQEKYKAVTTSSYKLANGIVIAYDVTRRESFAQAEAWLEHVRNNSRSDTKIILVGNKIDLLESREISEEEGKAFAEKHGLFFWETSAMTNQHECVNRAFGVVINECLKDHLTSEEHQEFLKIREEKRKSALELNSMARPSELKPSSGSCCK